MKQFTFLLVFFLLILSHVYAQPPARLKKVLVSRYSTNVNGYAPWDSTVYYYSGNNKGYLDNEIFFNGYKNKLTGVAGNPWTSFTENMYSIHVLNNPELQYDSLLLYQRHLPAGATAYLRNKQDIANSAITKYSTEEYISATNNWYIKRAAQYSYQNGMLSKHVYSHNLSSDTVDYRYVQNTNNLPDSLIVTYSSGQVIVYTYSYSNNQLSELNTYSIPGHYKTLFDYSTAGHLSNSTTLKYNAGTSAWDTAHLYNYTYAVGGNLTREEFMETNTLTSQGLELLYAIDITYDNNSNRIEDVIHFDFYKHGLNTGLVKVARKQYGYNSFGLISDYEVTHWDDSSQAWELGADSLFGPSQKVTLEYEAHWPQDVSAISAAKSDVTIFPSPASGFITVKADEMPIGKLEAVIYDMQGRLLRRWADESNGVYSRTIPVQELPAGNYILQLNGKETKRSEKFVIYR